MPRISNNLEPASPAIPPFANSKEKPPANAGFSHKIEDEEFFSPPVRLLFVQSVHDCGLLRE
jgi:hypothetical protein